MDRFMLTDSSAMCVCARASVFTCVPACVVCHQSREERGSLVLSYSPSLFKGVICLYLCLSYCNGVGLTTLPEEIAL